MASEREQFFNLESYAVVGNSDKGAFPKLTFGNLKKSGKKVFAVDLSGAEQVEGCENHGDLDSLPESVQGVILEVPKEQTLDQVQQVVNLGVKDLWIHMGTETDEALELARQSGLKVRHGTCAVMYTQQGISYHSIHKWIMQLTGKY